MVGPLLTGGRGIGLGIACTVLGVLLGLALAIFVLAVALAPPWLAWRHQPAGPPPESAAVILAVNDIYRIEGVEDGARGGLARLRTLRAELEAKHPDLLVLHAGDVLSPSFLGRRYKGEQMIDTLNLLDGRRKRGTSDPRLLVAFGNHEFDDSSCQSPEVLRQRVLESEFTWLASNIDFTACAGAAAMLPASAPVKDRWLVKAGGITVGLYALLLPFEDAATAARQPAIGSVTAIARNRARALREAGAEVVVALTHLNVNDDLRLLNELGDDRPDLVIGGHDHTHMALPEGEPRLFKADADAVSANVITITLRGGKPRIAWRRELLDARVPKDPLVEQVVEHWLARNTVEFCAERREADTCLDEVIGLTSEPIEAEELQNRGRETGFGDWIADRMVAARSTGIGKGGPGRRSSAPRAEVALLNSGTLRLNADLPRNATLRRKHFEQMDPFSTALMTFEVTAGTLWKAVDNSIARRGTGGWAHVAGLAVSLSKGADSTLRASRILVRRADGRIVEIDRNSTERFGLVTTPFVACGGDGYALGLDLSAYGSDSKACRDRIKAAVDPQGPDLGLKEVLLQAVRDEYAQRRPIAPAADRRICEPGTTGCLVERWSAAARTP